MNRNMNIRTNLCKYKYSDKFYLNTKPFFFADLYQSANGLYMLNNLVKVCKIMHILNITTKVLIPNIYIYIYEYIQFPCL